MIMGGTASQDGNLAQLSKMMNKVITPGRFNNKLFFCFQKHLVKWIKKYFWHFTKLYFLFSFHNISNSSLFCREVVLNLQCFEPRATKICKESHDNNKLY